MKIWSELKKAEKQISMDFKVSTDETLLFKGRTYVPDILEIKDQLLEKTH